MNEFLEQLKEDNIPIEKQIDILSKYLMQNFETEMGNKGKGESAIEMAIRLLELLKQVKVPNSDGNIEVVGDSIVEIIGVKWECAICGNYNTDEIQGNRFNTIDYKETQCKKCKAKHLVEVDN